MQTFRCTLQPEAAFGTPLTGDTLFGHLCWALRWRQGEAALTALLAGYTDGQPFAVVSDAFPAGLLPRPNLPMGRLGLAVDASQRKADKARAWLPADRTDLPLSAWVAQAVALTGGDRTRADVVTQNTIHRLTGTTGTGPFAPRQVERTVYPVGQRLVVYAVLDTDRLALAAFEQALQDIGANGYGRDASTGLGKFRLVEVVAHRWSEPADAGHMLTLAPCAPDPAQVDAADSHYQPLTRFGRHGSLHALGGQPFKKPVLLMRSAAVLALQPRSDDTRRTAPLFHGRGLGGVGDPVSMVQPATVHQGYAPVLPLALPAATTSHVQSTARTA